MQCLFDVQDPLIIPCDWRFLLGVVVLPSSCSHARRSGIVPEGPIVCSLDEIARKNNTGNLHYIWHHVTIWWFDLESRFDDKQKIGIMM